MKIHTHIYTQICLCDIIHTHTHTHTHTKEHFINATRAQDDTFMYIYIYIYTYENLSKYMHVHDSDRPTMVAQGILSLLLGVRRRTKELKALAQRRKEQGYSAIRRPTGMSCVNACAS